MRPVHQGAPRQFDRRAPHRAVAHAGAGFRGGAARAAHLTESARLVGAIIAGGASRRFGGKPKGLELVGDVPIIERVRDALRPLVAEIDLIANDPRASGWLADAVVRPDIFPGTGGMAGVHAALSGGGDALVVAWDMPFVSTNALRMIRDAGVASGADACVPESESPHGLEPFCAWYSHTALPGLEEFLRTGGGPARAFLEQVNVRRIPLDAVRRTADPRTLFFSVNTPADLARARAIAAQ